VPAASLDVDRTRHVVKTTSVRIRSFPTRIYAERLLADTARERDLQNHELVLEQVRVGDDVREEPELPAEEPR